MTLHRYPMGAVVYVAGHRATVCGLEAPRSATDWRDPIYVLLVEASTDHPGMPRPADRVPVRQSEIARLEEAPQ
jgi:hypothetical protein